MAAVAAEGEEEDGWRVPPKEILDIVNRPLDPSLSFSPDRTKMLQLFSPAPHPPIHELSRKELKLAGLRIDPETHSRSRMTSYTVGMSIVPAGVMVPTEEGSSADLHITGFPPGSRLHFVSWSPDSRHLAFATVSDGGPGDPPRAALQLWLADVATGEARPLLGDRRLNSIFGDYSWLDESHIIAYLVPEGRGPPPPRPEVPMGPKIQRNIKGATAQARTYPDLLKDTHDEDTFEYYCTSELVRLDIRTGEMVPICPEPHLFTGAAVSPNDRYLMISYMARPFSYNVPCGRFPKKVELWDRDGRLVKELCDLPLAEDIPVAFNSCRKGPRGLGWRSDKPCEMYWMECQDGGDPAVEVSPRDIVYSISAEDCDKDPTVLAQTDLRCGGMAWGDGELALVYESWWKTRRSVVHMVAPDHPERGMTVLFDRDYEDVYSDPGSPMSRRNPDGTYTIAILQNQGGYEGRQLLLLGSGASPEGNRPFVDLLDLTTRDTTRLWQSLPPSLERASSIMSDSDDDFKAPITLDTLRILLTRESNAEQPQYFIRSGWAPGTEAQETQLTNFPHPYPTLKDMQKEVVSYERSDGVPLNATLYLPPGYDASRDGPLPVLMWAYPKEFKTKESAGQLRKSPHSFAGIGSLSPTLWLTRGFAVMDGPTFPIIGEGDVEANDTYVEQLRDCAQAAVNYVVGRGIGDHERIAVGGHSYGAFMTANLLAHTDLFAAGIARSGAYNRTLTPFGFQAEERTIWQAPDTYTKMSPFMNAHKVRSPILLIHGEDDNNTGTFPMQSERFYAALKGHGVACQLVLLPYESHGYVAHESVMHTLYEQDVWLDRFVKNKPDSSSSEGDDK